VRSGTSRPRWKTIDRLTAKFTLELSTRAATTDTSSEPVSVCSTSSANVSMTKAISAEPANRTTGA